MQVLELQDQNSSLVRADCVDIAVQILDGLRKPGGLCQKRQSSLVNRLGMAAGTRPGSKGLTGSGRGICSRPFGMNGYASSLQSKREGQCSD
ncbi:hypothetical protein D3C81_1899960 [compost metagenome]